MFVWPHPVDKDWGLEIGGKLFGWHHDAPSDIASIIGWLFTVHLRAYDRFDPVGTNEHLTARFSAICEVQGYALLIFLVTLQSLPEMNRGCRQLSNTVLQDAQHVGTINVQIGRAKSIFMGIAKRNLAHYLRCVVEPELGAQWPDRNSGKLVKHAKMAQNMRSIGAYLDPSANLTKRGSLFENLDVMSCLQE
jgi:hypothetical protein